ncbi:MAG: M20/M25/M40 family metallo-hydrolase, partial [Parasutterella excrementihominis]
MTTRRKFVSGCLAASLTPSFAFAAANDNASDFDMKQYVKELNELVSIDSKSGHVEGANKIADILEKRFKSIGWTVTTRDCAGRGKALIATNTPNQDHYDVVLSVHSDTVQPVGNAQKYPLTIKDNIAHGAGVADDKSSLNAVWWICKKIPPEALKKLNIAVIVNPGEESGSPASRAFMDEQAKKT